MTSFNPASLCKIVNPDFALTAMHGYEPHGEFKAFVRIAEPDQRPANMKVMEIHSSDMLKVRIRCDQIEQVIDDSNILSVELREYVS
jgi:hypothetical protein